MTLPTDERCRHVIKELDGDPALSEWEQRFVSSNLDRQTFTTAQREVVARLEEKFEV